MKEDLTIDEKNVLLKKARDKYLNKTIRHVETGEKFVVFLVNVNQQQTDIIIHMISEETKDKYQEKLSVNFEKSVVVEI